MCRGDEDVPKLTLVQQRRIDAAAAIATTAPEQITYQHTVLCQTSLPYRNPGDNVREWERKQGNIFLKISAGEVLNPKQRKFVKLGLPYGSRPRLITAYVNATAIKTASPKIGVGDSLTAFVKRLLDYRRSTPDGREVKRFKEQLSRLSASNIRMAMAFGDEAAYQVDTKIIDVMDLWLEKDERQRVLWPCTVELSPRYFESLTKHAVPLDERAIAALANSPLALDVYSWLAQRLHRIERGKVQRLSWQALYEQFGQGYGQRRDFRRSFLAVLREVHLQYRDAKVAADQEGMELRYSPPPVLKRLLALPGGRADGAA